MKRFRVMRHGQVVFEEEQAADNITTVVVDGGKPTKLSGEDIVIETRGAWTPQPEDYEPPARKSAAKKPAAKKAAGRKAPARKRPSKSKLATS